VQALLAAGVEVVAHDPQAEANFRREIGEQRGLAFADSAYEALDGADALVLMTEWAEYRRPSWAKVATLMRNRAIFDLRNQYSAAQVLRAGFHYECIGRPDSQSPRR